MDNPPKNVIPKLKFEARPTLWLHQRNGWNYAFGTVLMKNLDAKDGILCVSTVEEAVFEGKAIDEEWIGFIHQTPINNLPDYPDLQRLLKKDSFLKSLEKCRGIFVLSEYLKSYLIRNLPSGFDAMPIVRLFYPISPFPQSKRFDAAKFFASREKRVYFIGEFLRDFQSFYDLAVPEGYKKYLIKAPDVDFDKLYDLEKNKITLKPNDSVTLISSRVEDDEYDDILSSSIVFCQLFDAAANTLVLECMGRGTPLIINRLPGVEGYLGEDYPLFYENFDLNQASGLITNGKLQQASEYLRHRKTEKCFQPQSFLDNFVNSSIYRALPLPKSLQQDEQYTQFPRFDLSIVICSYKRVYNLKRLLECFVKQDCRDEYSFEIILWNNNVDTQAEVAAIVKQFNGKLPIRLIQSSKNYYCTIRLAMPKIMQSEILLICDDDVVPYPNYVSKFMSAYKKYGEAVYCFRGHVFRNHSVDHEHPEAFWKEYQNMDFFDQRAEDRQVHFAHACNCLIPKSLLLRISAVDLPRPEFALVDDYWMSFVFSHVFRVPIWKLKADDAFNSTDCADDESIAMFHSPPVIQQRTNFYIYHMKEGWPASVPLD